MKSTNFNIFSCILFSAFSAIFLHKILNRETSKNGDFLERSKIFRTKLLQNLWGEKTVTFLSAQENLIDSIFFVEVNDKLTQMPAKLLCAFESAAFKNPDKSVAVILNEDSMLTYVPFLSKVKIIII